MKLVLNAIADNLASLEETLIYKLLDRVQFPCNQGAYEATKSQFYPREESSLFELRLAYQEKMEALFGRYLIPEERPFHIGLPEARRHPPFQDEDLRVADYDTVNVTGSILVAYKKFLPSFCQPGDDGNWGSAVEHDVICLQAISKRIHYGAFYVAESKFESDPVKYSSLIKNKDEAGLLALLTRSEVELKILERLAHKVDSIQSVSDPRLRYLVPPEKIVQFFKDVIIPLTKEGEILYLLQRPL